MEHTFRQKVKAKVLAEMGAPAKWKAVYKHAVKIAMKQFDPQRPDKLPEIRAKARALWK